ncbi:MAG: serine/threonine-protein phosphatase [Isosphaeraceae bacterium]|nr:serine/threonine-protein phosphatase [Isosphaeraceae bacterium]
MWKVQKPARRRSHDPESTQDFPSIPAGAAACGPLQLRFGVVSDTGNVREHNEDNFYVPGRPSLKVGRRRDEAMRAGESSRDGNGSGAPPAPGPEGLFIVADGMGGQLAGEEASGMAVELIPRELAKRLAPEADDKGLQHAIREAIAKANEEILAHSHLGTEFSNMGTTVVLALFRGGYAFVTGIGDSRAYRLRDGRLEQLTRDHSLANALEEAGTIRPEEVENHKFKHVLYLYLGSKDARDGPEEIRVLDCRPGDKFLLTTDGLTGVVRDDVIAQILDANDDPQRTAQVLVSRALENRSKDNITCVVIHAA